MCHVNLTCFGIETHRSCHLHNRHLSIPYTKHNNILSIFCRNTKIKYFSKSKKNMHWAHAWQITVVNTALFGRYQKHRLSVNLPILCLCFIRMGKLSPTKYFAYSNSLGKTIYKNNSLAQKPHHTFNIRVELFCEYNTWFTTTTPCILML